MIFNLLMNNFKEEIEKEIKLDNFERVLDLCNGYIKSHSDYGYLYTYRGLAKDKLGQYKEAVKDFNEAIKLNEKLANGNLEIKNLANKNLADSYFYRGITKSKLKDYKNAIEDYEKSMKLNDGYWLVCYYHIGLAKNNLEEYEEAIKNFYRIMRETYFNISPHYYLFTYYNRTFAKLLLNKNSVFLNDFNEAIKLNDSLKPNYNHIDDIIYILFEEYRIDLITEIFNQLSKKEYDILWENDITFNLLRNKISSDKVLTVCKKTLLYEYLLLKLLSFNNKILKSEYTYNIEISHYTSLNVLFLLLADSTNKIRMTNISCANDPKEGKVLEDIFNKNGLNIKIKDDEKLITLQTSYCREKDSLTMFRLYGKEENKEATGICLVVDKKFFNDNYYLPAGIIEIKKEKNKSQDDNNINNTEKENTNKKPEKRNLYWMLYYNEEKNQLAFNPTSSKYSGVVVDLNNKKNNTYKYDKIEGVINLIFDNIIKCVKEINKQIKDNTLKNEIFANLFENIKYIIKHEAFFEEQELRMLLTLDYKNSIIETDNNKRLYTNYNELFNENKNYIKEIIIGSKIENKELIKDYIKKTVFNKDKETDNIKVKISEAPLR